MVQIPDAPGEPAALWFFRPKRILSEGRFEFWCIVVVSKHLADAGPNFIGAYFLEQLDVCDELVALFRAHPEFHQPGGVRVEGQGDVIDKDIKDSFDLSFSPDATAPPLVRYLHELQKCAIAYMKDYPYCDKGAPWSIIYPSRLQYYPPGGGYKAWHTERFNADDVYVTRHLVWMTYLNDVTEGGETEFFHQKLKVKPERGLTLIWPTDWTHTHRGVPSLTQEKYVVTGWYNYLPHNLVATIRGRAEK